MIKQDQLVILVLNMQLELVPLLHNGTQLLHNCVWLTDVANHFGIKSFIIEHKKLGAGSKALADVAGEIEYLEKHYFDATAHEEILSKILATNAQQIVLAGAESHVCILQTAFGLKALDKKVYILADTVSARNLSDHELALKRANQNGIELISQEMLFFETLRQSELSDYRDTAMKFLDGRYIK